jgi:hypothetical protein
MIIKDDKSVPRDNIVEQLALRFAKRGREVFICVYAGCKYSLSVRSGDGRVWHQVWWRKVDGV